MPRTVLALPTALVTVIAGCADPVSTPGDSDGEGPGSTADVGTASPGDSSSDPVTTAADDHAGDDTGDDTGSATGSETGAEVGCVADPPDDLLELELGVWTEITPPADPAYAGISSLAIDPCHPGTLYVGAFERDVLKSTDGGATWVRLSEVPDPDLSDRTTVHLDDADTIAIDPHDPDHMYATQGVHGTHFGFWITHDGGASWALPDAFPPAGTTFDVTQMSVDPADFDHAILSSHSDWESTPEYASGLLETRDGGTTWIAHPPPDVSWGAGTKGVFILHHPSSGTGDGDTWLATAEGTGGFWRTANAGATWEKVSDNGGPHGRNQFVYTSDGTVYAGGSGVVSRSTDNGLSWTAVENLPNQSHEAVGTDGQDLFTSPFQGPTHYWTSPASNGITWAPLSDQELAVGARKLEYDAGTGILYSVNDTAGLWAIDLAR